MDPSSGAIESVGTLGMTTDTFCRTGSLTRLRERSDPWDLVIIGGGATGVGVATDAANRGLEVLLLERFDFGSGTSSRSTKLVHGGVRYLKQGNITLVHDALRERTLLLNNAPHLVHDKSFLIPCASLWEWFFYAVGLKFYDLLAFSSRFGRSRIVSARRALELVPAMRSDRMRGAVLYHDGQFDDARLLINMAQTAGEQGACLANYMTVTSVTKDDQGKVIGIIAMDGETDERFQIAAHCVVNAAGPFCDDVRRLDESDCEPIVATSQGVHIVLPKTLFPGNTAMIVPKTSDGRVIFIVPWHDHAIVGTTDTAIPKAIAEPSPQAQEIQFLLETASEYLTRAPTIDDVLSVFTGIRPLVKGDKSSRTASLSRDHLIKVSPSKMITITGGKWTTVRKMAEDCVDKVIEVAALSASTCTTKTLPIHGATKPTDPDSPLSFYGTDRQAIENLENQRPELAEPIHGALNIHASQVVWAVQNEMARSVEDFLARRTRTLFLNAPAALEAAPVVASLMAQELGEEETWVEEQLVKFCKTAAHYLPPDHPMREA